MTKDELKNKLADLESTLVPEEGGEWLNVKAGPEIFHALAGQLRNHPELFFDYLFCLTCVDWKTHLAMVYHLESTRFRHILVVKVVLDRNNPEISSVTDLWKTAEFHEREVFEMFGVRFPGHPDLRKLILPDDWEGFPMRKDYEDPVNMIKL